MSEMDGFISSRVRYRAPMVLKIMAIIRPSLFKLLESNSKSSCSRYIFCLRYSCDKVLVDEKEGGGEGFNNKP